VFPSRQEMKFLIKFSVLCVIETTQSGISAWRTDRTESHFHIRPSRLRPVKTKSGNRKWYYQYFHANWKFIFCNNLFKFWFNFLTIILTQILLFWNCVSHKRNIKKLIYIYFQRNSRSIGSVCRILNATIAQFFTLCWPCCISVYLSQ